MAWISFTNFKNISRLRSACICHPVICQLRWIRKVPNRKPKWLPTAPSKVFRIPEHPYMPPEEKELMKDLLEEYYRKVDSMRKLFQDELRKKSEIQEKTQEQNLEEKEFLMLLEENQKENERIKSIREETLEHLFQEKQFEILQHDEQRKIEEQMKKEKVDRIVKEVKENNAFYLNYGNLEAAVEHAIDNPVNYNFALTVNGEVIWEGTPPKDYEEEIMKNLPLSTKSIISS